MFLRQSFQAEEKAEKLAQEAAESWLALVDAGKYSQSWNEAASFFKERVTAEQWESAVKSVREPLGKLESRILKRSSVHPDDAWCAGWRVRHPPI